VLRLIRVTRDQFYETPFRPKTFRTNFHPQMLDKKPSKNNTKYVYLSIMNNKLEYLRYYKVTQGHN
jgi:tellurite resistance-related uncharacterized protein